MAPTAPTDQPVFGVSIVEEDIQLTLHDLSRACRVEYHQVVALVREGVLEPSGAAEPEWRFSGPSLSRARSALRLIRDLQLDAHSVAIVLDLMDEIGALQARLRRAGRA